MLIIKGVLLRFLAAFLMLGLMASAIGAVLNSIGNSMPLWVLVAVFAVGLVFVKEAHRQLK